MCLPKRFVPVFLGFWGFLIYGGYEVIVSTVMVHVIKTDNIPENNKFLGLYCSENASIDVPYDWTISSTQYLHSAYYAGVLSTQLLGGYLASRFSPKKVSGITILISSILILVIPTAINVHIALVFVIRVFQGIFEIGIEAALPSVFAVFTMIAGGILIDKLIKSHLVSTTVGRKIALCVGFGVEACCFLGLRFIDKQEIALIVLCVGVAFGGLSASGYPVNLLDLAPQFAGILTGFLRLGILGSVVNTVVSGRLNPTNIEVWQDVFTISASILIAGAVFYGVFASGERQNWIEVPENKLLLRNVTREQEEDKPLTESE